MNRSEKKQLIATLNETLKKAELVVITQQSGLTVAEVTNLRRQMRQAGAGYKVAKNRLARLALEGTQFEGLKSMFTGPTAIAYSADPIAAAKAAVTYANSNEKLTIVGGAMGGQILDPNGIKALATLPSLDELRAKIIGVLRAPATRIAAVLQAPGGQLARVFKAYASKGESA